MIHLTNLTKRQGQRVLYENASFLVREGDRIGLVGPNGAGKTTTMAMLRGLVGELSGSGRTVLVSSHDLSELEQICDWLVLVDTGRSLYQGPTRELLDGVSGGIAIAPRRADDEPALEELLVRHGLDVGRHDGRLVVAVDGRNPNDVAASVNRAAFDAGIVLVELSPLRTTLEDRFLSMVNGGSR
jgi:ABC-2 type transport system ATP-binding protein